MTWRAYSVAVRVRSGHRTRGTKVSQMLRFVLGMIWCLCLSLSGFRGLPQDVVVRPRYARADFHETIESYESQCTARFSRDLYRSISGIKMMNRETADFLQNCSPSRTSCSCSSLFCRPDSNLSRLTRRDVARSTALISK